jgi:hypothetical protein
MPRTSEMKGPGKFLRQSDVGSGVRLTIAGCSEHNTAMDGAPQEMKWCLEFRQIDKPLVLNQTNIQILEKVFGSDNSDDWIDNEIIAYTDPNVSYGGKLVGGIRLRAPRSPVKVVAKPTPLPAEDPDDDVPFVND